MSTTGMEEKQIQFNKKDIAYDDLLWPQKFLCHLLSQRHPKATHHNKFKEYCPVSSEIKRSYSLTGTPLGPGMPGIPSSPWIPCEI